MTVPARILVVDDDAGTLNTLAAIFEEDGYGVIACKNGAEAMNQVLSNRAESLT